MSDEIEVAQVAFDAEGGLIIGYMQSTDVRVQGAVVMQRQVRLDGRHPDYAEDIEALQRKAVKVLRNALEDFESSEPWTPEDEGDEDDERGMGE